MELKRLELKEILKIYNENMKSDFPENELRPFHSIEYSINHKYSVFCGFYENNALCAYAMLSFSDGDEFLLLDYFAVVADLRGRSIGHKVLEMLKTEFKNACIILETEDVAAAKTADELYTRIKRDRFYTDCGAVKTDISYEFFKVNYAVFYISKKPYTDEIIHKELMKIYKYIVQSVNLKKL